MYALAECLLSWITQLEAWYLLEISLDIADWENSILRLLSTWLKKMKAFGCTHVAFFYCSLAFYFPSASLLLCDGVPLDLRRNSIIAQCNRKQSTYLDSHRPKIIEVDPARQGWIFRVGSGTIPISTMCNFFSWMSLKFWAKNCTYIVAFQKLGLTLMSDFTHLVTFSIEAIDTFCLKFTT